MSSPSPLLLTFAHGVASDAQRVPARRIFDELISRQLWFVPRMSPKYQPEVAVLFYQAGAGAVGEAKIAGVEHATAADIGFLRNLGIGFLTVKLVLDSTVKYEVPVDFSPIVDKLSFVANKTYWGHSLRITPKAIHQDDFEIISHMGRRLVGSERAKRKKST